MKTVKLFHEKSGQVLADSIKVANNPWLRVRGLLGTKSLPQGSGLWITPCNSIHMLGMRFPIDLIYLDKKGVILRLVHSLQPNHLGPIIFSAHSVLELPAGFLKEHPLELNDTLRLQ